MMDPRRHQDVCWAQSWLTAMEAGWITWATFRGKRLLLVLITGEGCCCHLMVEITRSDVRYLCCYYCYYYFRYVDRSWGWFGCKITVLQNAAFAAGVRGIPAVNVSPAQPDRSPIARFLYLIFFFFNHLMIRVWFSDGRGDTRGIDQWSETSMRWDKRHPSGRWLPSTFTLNTFKCSLI